MAPAPDRRSNGEQVSLADLEPPPARLLESPLDYIAAEHFRQRSLCAGLRAIAGHGRATRENADVIVAYLDIDMPRHHRDEEEDIFPLLRQRIRPEDDLADMLDHLTQDHRHTETLASAITAVLTQAPITDTIAIDEPTAATMHAFAATEHRHLAIENGIVLAIAKKRLKPLDLETISRAMKSRRGIPT
jgi:hemerythrin-like domain-containing protein